MKQLSKTHSTEEVIKKSTFIAIVANVNSVEQAMDFLSDHSDFDATHNCWAYRLQQVYRFTDDGEPSGTAGKPILNAITGQEFDNTVALVIRHYGGIKLGTGGLMRAYGGGISRCLQAAECEVIQDLSEVMLKVPFQYIQAVHNLSNTLHSQIISEDFNAEGALIIISLLTSTKQEFKEKAINISKGQIEIITPENS
ncbi:MAG: YigZ family protein [Alcanivoracaceae bacterium]|nr:YigZ family protein [Alcanivoracaceae bacterium]